MKRRVRETGLSTAHPLAMPQSKGDYVLLDTKGSQKQESSSFDGVTAHSARKWVRNFLKARDLRVGVKFAIIPNRKINATNPPWLR